MDKEAQEARRTYMREWRARKGNQEAINKYHREWRANNKDRIKQYNEDYWQRVAQKQGNLES